MFQAAPSWLTRVQRIGNTQGTPRRISTKPPHTRVLGYSVRATAGVRTRASRSGRSGGLGTPRHATSGHRWGRPPTGPRRCLEAMGRLQVVLVDHLPASARFGEKAGAGVTGSRTWHRTSLSPSNPRALVVTPFVTAADRAALVRPQRAPFGRLSTAPRPAYTPQTSRGLNDAKRPGGQEVPGSNPDSPTTWEYA